MTRARSRGEKGVDDSDFAARDIHAGRGIAALQAAAVGGTAVLNAGLLPLQPS